MSSPVLSLDDPRLDPYRNLKQTNLTRWSGLFIAEGKLVVERLLASRSRVRSILVSERRLDVLATLPFPPSVEVLVIADDLARQLTGFEFHAGVMACGWRAPSPRVEDLTWPARSLIVACPRMTDPDNLGGLIRLCRAFGVSALLLGEGCADPFSRRVLRVSMGNAFDLTIVECNELDASLETLRRSAGFTLTATVLDEQALPLHRARRHDRDILLLGNEAEGLGLEWIGQSDRRLTIPMQGGTDSLNVAVAAGIFLHALRSPHFGEASRG